VKATAVSVVRLLKFPRRNQPKLDMDKQTFLKGSHFTDFALEADNVQDATVQILARLDLLYGAFQPGKDFITHVYLPMTEATLDKPTEFAFQPCDDAKHTKHTFAAHMDSMLRSCAYTIEADRAEAAGSQQTAWRHIANAQYYLGLLWGSLMLEPALASFVTSRAKAGSKKRNEKYEPLRKLARALAGQGTYPSKRQAVLAIKDQIVAESQKGENPVNLVPDNAERTITSWLSDMQFASKRTK